MTSSRLISRRKILAGASLVAATACFGASAPARAPFANVQSGVYRYKLGHYQLTALYDGLWSISIDEKFIRNATLAQANEALAAGFLPPNRLPISYTALLVNTGKNLILIDAGTAGQLADSAGYLLANLKAAGVTPQAIDTILISHFHPDHIDGLKTKDGVKVFPNAEIFVPEGEWAFWTDEGNMRSQSDAVKKYFLNARRIFRDIAKGVHRFRPGAEVAPGITAIAAYGHTPGHVAFTIASGNDSLLVISDAARNPWLFVRHPEWQPSFDMDGPMAVDVRKKLLERAAADRTLVAGYHFPFPACGHIARAGNGYELIPALWQPL